MREIGAEVKIEDLRRLVSKGAEKVGKVGKRSKEQKRELKRKKSGLKGRKEKIDDGLTVMERKIE